MKHYMNKFVLFLYDVIVFGLIAYGWFILYRGAGEIQTIGIAQQVGIAFACIFLARIIGKIYRQVWRYGGIQCYIRLLIADIIAFLAYAIIERFAHIQHISFAKLLAFVCMNTLAALAMRMFYRYAYKCGNDDSLLGSFNRTILKIFALGNVSTEADPNSQKTRIAIIGAGTVGISLAEDLKSNPKSSFAPRCFVDNDSSKVGRDIHGLPVLPENDQTMEDLKSRHIQEVIFTVPNMSPELKHRLFDLYQKNGFRVKTYDFPNIEAPGQKREVREFKIEDLLFREPIDVIDKRTIDYYKHKVIMITGGGGSIGSELCRQLAKMNPKLLVIVDIYENCAYDLQQSLKISHPEIDLAVEIVSITNKKGMARVFEAYHPEIVINAAAHKHVPLMEKNCIEAVENNIYGCRVVIELCEEYGAERFMMVSTDKAVNPTNVMGTTKRFCEMIMQAYSTRGKVKCSATRFGNVLGSAGSVIPLFERQIKAGGPVTLTDKRIIRYFMTIPEASQLVLVSGAMAENGQLFVLDMGQPVKIYDLATNMIAMSGKDIEIVEIGLRPGEKLYEELLVKTEELEKTDNDRIFIEKEEPVSMEQLEAKFRILDEACKSADDDGMREALRACVPTFKRPEEVNCKVAKEEEPKEA